MAKKKWKDFVSTHNGRAFDVDGAYGAQCWDGYATYCLWLGIPYRNGNAVQLWGGAHAGCTTITNWSALKPGDIVIWGGEYGHVAMFDHWSGGAAYFMGQNQGNGSNLTTGKAFNIVALGQVAPGAGPFLGAYRPNNVTDGTYWKLSIYNGIITKVELQ